MAEKLITRGNILSQLFRTSFEAMQMFSCNLSREFGGQTIKDRVGLCYFYFTGRDDLKESFIDIRVQGNFSRISHVHTILTTSTIFL